MDNEDTEKIFKTLGPMADEWAGVNLVPMVIYGIRRYLNNSALFSHLDRYSVRRVSILFVICKLMLLHIAIPLYSREKINVHFLTTLFFLILDVTLT